MNTTVKKESTFSSKASLLSRWKNRDKKAVETTEITKIPEEIAVPLSREQKRLWFLQQLFPDNPFYNYSELYRLQGDLQVSLFEKSIRLIEDKHDILRSNFQVEEGVPKVHTTPTSNSVFSYYDFSDASYEVASQKADALIRTHASHTFHLSDETLLQSTVIKVAENDFLFLIVMHHIITDKWSMKVFRKELAAHYASLVKGMTPDIEKPEIQYASYAHWQGSQEVNNKHLDYWKQKLSGDLPTLNLPTDYPKKAQPSYKGTFHKQVYSDQTSKAFFDACKKLEATPYVTMLSIYYVLLQKYAGQEDILVGTPITKRDQTRLENLIGFFNDTLVLRTKVEKETSFRALVKEVKKTTLDAFSNKDISFDTLVNTLKPTRSLSVHPFFQVMFLYHKVPETPTLGDDIKITYEPYDAGVAKFDLTLYISEDEGALMSLMEYATDLFDATTIERMHTHFERILTTVIQNPEVILSEIEVQTPQETQFYTTLEAPVQEYQIPHQGIHEIITAQALQQPDAIAVAFKDKKITYKELNERATQIAHQLLEQGIQRNDIVGVCIERSEHMIIGLLGILKAGAAYLPLDPEYPSDRISYILNNAFAKAVITQQHLVVSFENVPVQTLTLEAILETNHAEVNLPKVESSDLAYVIYTSGSTGMPKGVPITHKNIINSTLSRTDFYGYDPKAFLVMSSVSFDSSKTGIFWSLCTGGTLVISEKHLEQDIDRLVHTIHQNKVTHTLMLPSLYTHIVNYGDVEKLTSLDTVIVAGEACATQLARLHFDTLPEVKLYNEYGPTESTVWCIAHQLQPSDANANSIPIGRPIKNIQVYILDDDAKRVPYGTPGELYIGGLGLASGYLNDPEKTAQAFTQHPFNTDVTKRLYKTGDIAKYRADGTIEFLGRKDQQVKIRGYRIELDEIAEQINIATGVQQAIVMVQNETDAIDWETLTSGNASQLANTLTKYISNTEVHQLLASIETLPEEAIAVILDTLD
ncbi:amino acid adenylation domain-containing protein [uncultured Dokdonia sp.]|uniref:non-ribosomal peptide synthetase n=1 Tax=uncultured Dokdonia sp. TaxID=575653 RepID=UPI002630F6FA|nr:amino acid adenylation domain-containing protein [uncultured Dokdonia sp.]